MNGILSDWHIFTSAFGFLGTFVASVVGLLKYNSLLKNRLEVKKYNLANATERLKAEYSATVISNLQSAIASILPAIAEHTRSIQEANKAVKVVGETVALAQMANVEAKRSLSALLLQHEDFVTRMSSVQKGGELIGDRLKNIETYVEELKSGNIFVKTKT